MRNFVIALVVVSMGWFVPSLEAVPPGAKSGKKSAKKSVAKGKKTSSKKMSPHHRKLTFEDARHFLSRTGFGGTPQQIKQLSKYSRVQVVNQLLRKIRTSPKTEPPKWAGEPGLPSYREAKKKGKKALQARNQKINNARLELRMWWLKEFCTTDSPFTEKMVLFWHNHFTSAVNKANWATWMYDQLQLFRSQVGGNFRHLLHAVYKDRAMVLYLDTHHSHKKKPNENFARELMELFTLGEGHYTEKDIKEAARCFTGYRVDVNRGLTRFYPRRHDWGKKTFLGKEGYFDGDDIIEILLQHSRTAEFIVEKLWREFISYQPNEKEVKRLAKIFRNHKYEMKPLLKAFFLSPHFWAKSNRGNLIKSPVELMVGTVRLLGMIPQSRDALRRMHYFCSALGQNLTQPPNVKGWPGGKDWITSHTLLERRRLLLYTVNNMGLQVFRVGYCNMKCPHCTKKRKGQLHRRNVARSKVRKNIVRNLFLGAAPAVKGKKKNMKKMPMAEIKKAEKSLLPGKAIRPLPRTNDPVAAVRHMILDHRYQLK